MPKTSEMKDRKFIGKDDVGKGLLVTITGCDKENVAVEDAPKELKWCLMFAEIDKPLVLNATNIALAEQVCGSNDTDQWIGHQIVLYVDPTVSYAGRVVGGVRIRRPKAGAVKLKPAPVVAPVDPDDDIPF